MKSLRKRMVDMESRLGRLESNVVERFEAVQERESMILRRFDQLQTYADRLASRCVDVDSHNELVARVEALERGMANESSTQLMRCQQQLNQFHAQLQELSLDGGVKLKARQALLEDKLAAIAKAQKQREQRIGEAQRADHRRHSALGDRLQVLEEGFRGLRRQLRETLTLVNGNHARHGPKH